MLLKGGCRNHAAICAAEAMANLVSHNGINQDAVADLGGVEAIVELLSGALNAWPRGVHQHEQLIFRYTFLTGRQATGSISCLLICVTLMSEH